MATEVAKIAAPYWITVSRVTIQVGASAMSLQSCTSSTTSLLEALANDDVGSGRRRIKLFQSTPPWNEPQRDTRHIAEIALL